MRSAAVNATVSAPPLMYRVTTDRVLEPGSSEYRVSMAAPGDSGSRPTAMRVCGPSAPPATSGITESQVTSGAERGVAEEQTRISRSTSSPSTGAASSSRPARPRSPPDTPPITTANRSLRNSQSPAAPSTILPPKGGCPVSCTSSTKGGARVTTSALGPSGEGARAHPAAAMRVITIERGKRGRRDRRGVSMSMMLPAAFGSRHRDAHRNPHKKEGVGCPTPSRGA